MPVRLHRARVMTLPVPGAYCTVIDSDHHFGRHWHNSYGFGLIDRGAQAWRSGRGNVRGYPGQIISTNPGSRRLPRPGRIVRATIDEQFATVDTRLWRGRERASHRTGRFRPWSVARRHALSVRKPSARSRLRHGSANREPAERQSRCALRFSRSFARVVGAGTGKSRGARSHGQC